MANTFLNNDGLCVMPGYSFILRVEGIQDLPCKSIKNLKRENEFEYIQEGGLNDYVHIKRKPISKPFTFQVERYAGIDYTDPLPLGAELTLPLLLYVFDRVEKYQNWVDFHRLYTFTGCTVIAKDYGELDAEQSRLVLETTTIAFREMVCLDQPVQAGVSNI